MIRKLKSKSEDFASGRIGGHRIDNDAKIISYICRQDFPIYSFKKDMFRFSGDNRKIFKKAFGPPSFYWTGEFRFHCWLLEFENVEFVITTAKVKGTGYESNRPHPTDLVIRFLNELSSMVNNLPPE